MIDVSGIKETGLFRFKELNGEYLLTNEVGDYIYLDKGSFEKLVSGTLKKSSAQYRGLKKKGFIQGSIDYDKMIERYRRRSRFLGAGTSLHIIVVTLRCDHSCIYCHASAKGFDVQGLDMDISTAERVVDTIFDSPSQDIVIEFQGGEPLLNFDTVKFIIDYAHKKNRDAKKNLMVTMVTNFGAMSDSILKFLRDKKVALCTSIDGPQCVHNENRSSLKGLNTYKNTVKWFKKAAKEYKDRVIHNPNALTTITRSSLDSPKEIVDEYLKLGLECIHIRQLNPFGMAKRAWQKIGYSPEEFIRFYKKVFDYIIELNINGEKFFERTARIFLRKILTDTDPNFLELRSPCGAGIGQLAYNYNGDVYTCDEGRMAAMMKDDSFRLGSVMEKTYKELVGGDVVRAVCVASLLDNLPGCSSCVYKPYCGVCPIYNYMEEGNIFAMTPRNGRCRINMAILDIIFEGLKDKKRKKIFKDWVDSSVHL